jgi:hypothetical protein
MQKNRIRAKSSVAARGTTSRTSLAIISHSQAREEDGEGTLEQISGYEEYGE